MSRKISVGIDIGTYHVKVLVAESMGAPGGKSQFKIKGSGYAESKGMRHGYVVNKEDIIKSIRQAISQAEKSSGVKIKDAYVSIGGVGLAGWSSIGSVIISRADSEITELDIEKVMEASKIAIPASQSQNRKIVHKVPVHYKIDGKPVLGNRPLGLKGNRLEVKTLFITCMEQHLNDLVEAVEEADIEVIDVVVSPLAASLVTLTKAQKIAGVVLTNIGAETVSIVVFENNIPISLEVFPIGGTDITNDIALGLKIPLEEAEDIKRGTNSGFSFSKKKLDEIIVARLSDIFDLIEAHLKKMGRSGLLPAGIVITGGSSGIATIEELAKASLNLPSRIASMNFGGNIKDLKDTVWSVVYGLCILGLTSPDEKPMGLEIVHRTKNKVVSWLKQFLP